MKVIYIKDFVGQQKGNVINTDKSTADFLIAKGVCELYQVSAKVEVIEKAVNNLNVEVKQPLKVTKPKGRPKKK